MGDRLSLIRERHRLFVARLDRERREIERELLLEKSDDKEVLIPERGEGSKEALASGGNGDNG
jgi:hypothetical protein